MKKYKIPWKLILALTAAVLFILNFSGVLQGLSLLWNAALPLILGGCLAFVLNLIMYPIESWFRNKSPKLEKKARPLAITLSLLIFIGIISLLCVLVLPQLVESIQLLIRTIPGYVRDLQEFLSKLFKDHPQIADYINSLNIDWNSMFQKITGFLSSGVQGALNSAVTVVTSITSATVNSIIMLIFAIYILADKERFVRLYHRLCALYLPKEKEARLTHILVTFDSSFRSFVIGQCTDALILGTLCTLGMWLFQLPYAPMIGTLVGVTNIIPMIGAFIGGGIGCFLVFTVSPMKALVFLIFLCVIQQFESNVIYPRIVGNSVGLPGIFVTVVIVIGGALAGVAGMVMGIPVAAAIYKLLSEYIAQKEIRAGLRPDPEQQPEKAGPAS
ncbi:AI-2E family transporter [uncultured Faecalibaculum sp.]|uniref:AI-2E family transporter n=1 Tax=uncultured Faecalibaculum sp. TaxID=1729681 RepID=UPI002601078F|nr:AI-2E family transporter [uncultured Faecalibaculum sp.]